MSSDPPPNFNDASCVISAKMDALAYVNRYALLNDLNDS